MLNVAIIGCSKVGASFAISLNFGLKNINIILCKVTNKPLHKELKTYKNTIKYDLKSTVHSSKIIFIAIKDDKIPALIKQILKLQLDLNGKYFLHFSGYLTSDVFLPLKKKFKINVASIHPIQSFPSIKLGRKKIYKIWWAYEGNRKILKFIKPLIKKLKGNIVVLEKNEKILHHIACVFSANFLTGLIFNAQNLVSQLKKIPFKIYYPLIETVINNIKNSPSIENVLTGPVIRGDIKTIQSHIVFLKKYPNILECYKAMSRTLLDMSKYKLDSKTFKIIKNLVK